MFLPSAFLKVIFKVDKRAEWFFKFFIEKYDRLDSSERNGLSYSFEPLPISAGLLATLQTFQDVSKTMLRDVSSDEISGTQTQRTSNDPTSYQTLIMSTADDISAEVIETVLWGTTMYLYDRDH